MVQNNQIYTSLLSAFLCFFVSFPCKLCAAPEHRHLLLEGLKTARMTTWSGKLWFGENGPQFIHLKRFNNDRL